MKRNGGFTLVEVLLASTISVLVAGGLLTMVTMGNSTWKEGSANITLQSSGRLILNQIARGSHGEYGLREANYQTAAVEDDGRAFRFVVDENEPPTYEQDDDTACRFYLQGERIWFDPDTSVDGNEYTLVPNGRVQDIVFTKHNSYVTIDLTMEDYASPRADAYVKLSTTVFLRKARQVLQ